LVGKVLPPSASLYIIIEQQKSDLVANMEQEGRLASKWAEERGRIKASATEDEIEARRLVDQES